MEILLATNPSHRAKAWSELRLTGSKPNCQLRVLLGAKWDKQHTLAPSEGFLMVWSPGKIISYSQSISNIYWYINIAQRDWKKAHIMPAGSNGKQESKRP